MDEAPMTGTEMKAAFLAGPESPAFIRLCKQLWEGVLVAKFGDEDITFRAATPDDPRPVRSGPFQREWSLSDQSLDRANRGTGTTPDPSASASTRPDRWHYLCTLCKGWRHAGSLHTCDGFESDTRNDN